MAFEATPILNSNPDPAAPSACPDIHPGECRGDVYQLSLDGSSVFTDPACPVTAVNVHLTQCTRGTSLELFSCPSDEIEARRNCVWLYVGPVGDNPSGTGEYFDAAGTRYALEVNQLEFAYESAPSETIQSGIIGGTLTGGDAGATPFSLAFKGCLHGPVVCLL
jgi:hypothetical protein